MLRRGQLRYSRDLIRAAVFGNPRFLARLRATKLVSSSPVVANKRSGLLSRRVERKDQEVPDASTVAASTSRDACSRIFGSQSINVTSCSSCERQEAT